MDELEVTFEAVRDLTTSEQLMKLVLGAVAGFLAKKFVEDAVEARFRYTRP